MGNFWSELLTIIGSYIAVILLFFVGTNFFSAGFFFTWLKVKLSRGKKILVTVRTITQDYHSAGIIDKGFLVFKDKGKEERRINLPENCIFKGMGVNRCVVDDEKNCVLVRDLKGVGGFDAVKYNDLYIRALYKPAIFDSKEKILLAVVIVTLIAVGLVGFLVYTQTGRIDQVLQLLGKIGSIKEVV